MKTSNLAHSYIFYTHGNYVNSSNHVY